MNDSTDVYSRIIFQDEKREAQIRLTVNEFREVEYLHLRRYYMDFDEEWKPSKEGISIPLDIDNTRNLFEAMAEILSLAESREVIEEHFGDLIRVIYQ